MELRGWGSLDTDHKLVFAQRHWMPSQLREMLTVLCGPWNL